MKVTDGFILDSLERTNLTLDMAEKIHAGIGTKYERQDYTENELFWSCRILMKPVDFVGRIKCGCIYCRSRRAVA